MTRSFFLGSTEERYRSLGPKGRVSGAVLGPVELVGPAANPAHREHQPILTLWNGCLEQSTCALSDEEQVAKSKDTEAHAAFARRNQLVTSKGGGEGAARDSGRHWQRRWGNYSYSNWRSGFRLPPLHGDSRTQTKVCATTTR